MPLTAGDRLGLYEIVALLGRGGMGEVYRATDTKLGRDVALKILSERLADSSGRRRFQREAKLASALNHPHIVSVYDAGEWEGLQYLVTEFIDGGTLKQWASASKRTWRQVVELLVGIAEALDAAHSAGILHRDIKPENILVARNNYAKLTDFGLAKLDDASQASTPDQTRTLEATAAGMILGTIAFMSPEQASAQPLDARSDIFSFGLVLYEVLAGRRAFPGATDLEVLQKIIHAPPEPLEDDMPWALRLAIEKALEKDPGERYQSMRELAVDLRGVLRRPPIESRQAAPTEPSKAAPQKRLWRIGAATLGLVAAVAMGWYLGARTSSGGSAPSIQMQRLTDAVGLEESPALSPDGRTVAFVAESGGRRQILLRLLAGGAPLAITKDNADHYAPRWAPDSASLIYFTPGQASGDLGTIWEIPALGGTPRRLVRALGPGDLSRDGNSLAFFRFSDGQTELVVAARDLSSTRTVARLSQGICSSLRWSPDGRLLAFLHEPGSSFFATRLMVVDSSGGTPRLLSGNLQLQGITWAPGGSSLIVSSAQGSTLSYPPTNSLWSFPINGGLPKQLTFDESSYESPDMSMQGTLVVSRVRAQSDIWKFPITGEPGENASRAVRITRQTGRVQTVSVSPDDTEVAFLSDSGGHANVWVARTSDGEMRQLTHESDSRFVIGVPLWSPRGDLVQYLSDRNTNNSEVTLWLVKPDGSDVRDLGTLGAWACWSGDGKWLYYSKSEKGVYQVLKVPVEGGPSTLVRTDNAVGCAPAADGSSFYYARMLSNATGAADFEIRAARPENGPSQVIGQVSGTRVPTGAINFQPYVSPDGKWLAMPLIDGSTTNLWTLSTAGGTWRKLTDFSPKNVLIARRIAWSRDGKSLYASLSEVDSDIVLISGLKP